MSLGAHADQCHQTAAAGIGKLAPLAHELEGHGCNGIVLVSLHEDPDVSICVKVCRAGGLVALNRDGVDGAGVDAPTAQDTAVGYAGTAIGRSPSTTMPPEAQARTQRPQPIQASLSIISPLIYAIPSIILASFTACSDAVPSTARTFGHGRAQTSARPAS